MNHSNRPRPSTGSPSDGELFEWDELLERYLAGVVAPSERRLIEQLLHDSPETATFVTQLREALQDERDAATPHVDRVRDRLAAKIGFAPSPVYIKHATPKGDELEISSTAVPEVARETGPRESHTQYRGPAMVSPRSMWSPLHLWRRTPAAAVAHRVAAIALLVVTLGFGAHYYYTTRATSAAAIGQTTYTTGLNEQTTITLRDGSQVTLAPGTTLVLDPKFGRGSRRVSLTGEAHFSVVNAANAPFIVRAGTVDTRVLGTDFLVRHYTGDPTTRVSVASGKVAVSTPQWEQTPVILAQGWVGVFTDSTMRTSAPTVSRHSEIKDGRLIFRDAPTSDVLATLSRWYGYEFHVIDSTLVQQNLTLALSLQSSRDALAAVQMVLEAEVSQSGNRVMLLSPGGKRIGSRNSITDKHTLDSWEMVR